MPIPQTHSTGAHCHISDGLRVERPGAGVTLRRTMLSRTELLAQLAAHPEYSCPPQVSVHARGLAAQGNSRSLNHSGRGSRAACPSPRTPFRMVRRDSLEDSLFRSRVGGRVRLYTGFTCSILPSRCALLLNSGARRLGGSRRFLCRHPRGRNISLQECRRGDDRGTRFG
jgi:hypothetical protein